MSYSRRSSSPAKFVRITYTSSLNELELSNGNNIYRLDSDLLNRILIMKKLEMLVPDPDSTDQLPDHWSDVASSSSDDPTDDESQPGPSHADSSSHSYLPKQDDLQPSDADSVSKSCLNNKQSGHKSINSDNTKAADGASDLGESYEKCTKLNKLTPEDPIKFSGDGCSSSKNLKTEHSSRIVSIPASSYVSISANSGAPSKRLMENNTPSKVLNDETNSSSRCLFQSARSSKSEPEKFAESADFGVVSERLNGALTLGDEVELMETSDQVCKTQDCSNGSQEKSCNLSDEVPSKINFKRPSELHKQTESLKGGNYASSKRDSRVKEENEKIRKRKKKPHPLRLEGKSFSLSCKKGNGVDDSVECLAKLELGLVGKRWSMKEIIDPCNIEVGLLCTMCSFSELKCLADFSHFYDSKHWSHEDVHLISKHYCPICKLIICCTSEAEVENHTSSSLHSKMLCLSKRFSVQQKSLLSSLDDMVGKKFNRTLMIIQSPTNTKPSLVPYDSTEDSSSGEELDFGETSVESPTNLPGATCLKNPLADVWVFPLKMEPGTYHDHTWVKFVGESGTNRLCEEACPMWSNAGSVRRCFIDEPPAAESSAAAYVQFDKSDAVQKLLKTHNEFVNAGNKSNLKVIKLDLLGGFPGQFRSECSLLFSNKEKFMEMITLSAKSMAAELNSSEAKSKLTALKTRIAEAIKVAYPKCVVHEFGSRVTGLCSSNSDFDLFADLTGQMYWGTVGPFDEKEYKSETFRHIDTILKILKGEKDFSDIFAIRTARIPILRFVHAPTNSRCDLSFRNGLCVENTKLISKYLDMNFKIRWLIVAVKRWAQVCDLTSFANFTSYALTWMVLFYLMRRGLIPPVSSLMDLQNSNQPLILGWKYQTTNKIGPLDIPESEEKLLQGFFGYYAQFKFNESVMCTRIGKLVPKNVIADCIKDRIPDELQDYINFIENHQFPFPDNSTFDATICCVQDPFALSHNLTRQVRLPVLREFRKYCDRANIEMLSWRK